MNYLKIIFLSFITSLAVGCSSIRVSDVQSQVQRPGLPTQTSVISYSWKVLVEKPIEIISISLYKDAVEAKMSGYVIYNLKDGEIINNNALPIGNYFISFKIPGSQLDSNEENIIQFEYTDISGKNILHLKSTKVPDLLMK